MIKNPKVKTTLKIQDDPKIENNLKHRNKTQKTDNPKDEDNHKYKDNPKNFDNIKNKIYILAWHSRLVGGTMSQKENFPYTEITYFAFLRSVI